MSRHRRLTALVVAAVLGVACASGGGTAERSPDAPATTRPEAGSVEAAESDPAEPPDAPLRLALVGVESTDPSTASPASPSATILADLLHDTLTTLGADGMPGPGLADAVAGEGGKSWRFTLRPGTTFADGSPVEAADVVATLERIRRLGGASLAAIALEDVQSVAALDGRTVEVVLDAPSALLPELLSSPVFGVIDRDVPPGALGSPLNPSGPYRVREASGERLVLERRRGGGPARVLVRFADDDGEAADAFAAGEADWAPVPADRLGPLDVDPDDLAPFHATLLLGINTNAGPLAAPSLRRAIALAIDRAAITAGVLGSTARAADGLVPAGVAGAQGACVAPCGPAPDEARRLVAEALPGGDVPSLSLLIDETTMHDRIARIVVEQLAAVGIDVTVDVADEGRYAAAVSAGQTQLHLASSLGLARSPAVHLLPWSSTSPDNTTGYRNEMVDLAIQAAAAEPDGAARAALWSQVEAAVLADAPVVPLVQLHTVAATGTRARGLAVRVDGSIDLSGVDPG